MLPGVVDLVVTYVPYLLTAALVAVALMLIYPVVAYSRNVAHSEGMVFLSAGFVWLAVANAVGFVHELPGVPRVPFGWGAFFSLLSAVFATVGLYYFARPFLRFGSASFDDEFGRDGTDEEGFPAEPPERPRDAGSTGGFEDADE